MKRLLVLAILAAALWWGYQRNWDFSSATANDAVLINRTGKVLERIRVTIGGETVVRELLEVDETASLQFRNQREGAFRVVWHVRGQMGEKNWSGGHLIGGPTASRHTFEFDSENGVVWHAEAKVTSK